MSQSVTPAVNESQANGRATGVSAPRTGTGEGQITVAETVVQKIAGKACREIAGVHAMGTSGTRAFGAVRERIPGSTGPNVAQGVGVEVGGSIQRNVKQSVERMTGLRVVEVNIAVDDVYLPVDGAQDTSAPARVS